jgi:SAM-dependent methyltransferase
MHAPHPAIVITTLIDALPAGARVLDLGAGAGTFPYEDYPRLRITAAELRPRPGAAARFTGRLAAASASALPFPDGAFDLVIAHWLFEHVDDLAGTYDEVRRVVKGGGLLAVAVPNSASFEDRLYRFTSFVYKYLLFHLSKRIEHVQVLSFLAVNRELYRRGFKLLRFREEDAGYCWLEVRQLRRFRPAILGFLSFLRRLGLDLFAGANYRLLYGLGAGARADGEAEVGGDYLRDKLGDEEGSRDDRGTIEGRRGQGPPPVVSGS